MKKIIQDIFNHTINWEFIDYFNDWALEYQDIGQKPNGNVLLSKNSEFPFLSDPLCIWTNGKYVPRSFDTIEYLKKCMEYKNTNGIYYQFYFSSSYKSFEEYIDDSDVDCLLWNTSWTSDDLNLSLDTVMNRLSKLFHYKVIQKVKSVSNNKSDSLIIQF